MSKEIKFENCLFRYRSVNENNLSALQKNRLYFSTPKHFNDPYDNLIYADLRKILSHINHNLYYGMDGYLEKLKKRDPLMAFLGYEFWKESNREKVVRDYMEMVCNAVDTIKKSIRNNVKIICFSEVYNSMLMWSHYAENHTGFSLMYDINDLKKANCYTLNEEQLDKRIRLEKVKYVEEQIDLSDDIEDYVRYNMMPNLGDVEMKDGSIPQYKLRESILQKSVEWQYEKEWRMIPWFITLEQQSLLGYIECKPKGIILGTHCNEEDSNKMISIAKKIGIPIYRMFLSEFSPAFKLEIGDGENAKVI